MTAPSATLPVLTLATYPPTPSFTPTARFLSALQQLYSTAASDPSGHSLTYHLTLESYVRKLAARSADERLNRGPGEALLLASAAQHVRRWERPRGEYPEGLSGYKMWRTALNKFHASIASSVLRSAGYEEGNAADDALVERVRELLLKKTLARPPLPREAELKDPEAHLFEDAVCLTFLSLEFVKFALPYLSSSSASSSSSPSPSSSAAPSSSSAPPPTTSDPKLTPAKLAHIVAKTWAKMTPLGRGVAVEELVGGLPDELNTVVLEAVGGIRDAWEQ